jgi:predicted DNA-binding protein YlxM (UPF0122 family)
MDKVYEISMLLDFYGQLITDRQYEILDLHYNSDYSLGEIAQLLNISRQGVYDNIKRGKSILTELEKKLGLVKRFSDQKSKAKEIMVLLEDIDKTILADTDKEKLNMAKAKIYEIIETL